MLKKLFVGRTVYFEPGRIMKGSNLIVEFVRSMVPRTDNVSLVDAVVNSRGLPGLLIHCTVVVAGPTAIAF